MFYFVHELTEPTEKVFGCFQSIKKGRKGEKRILSGSMQMATKNANEGFLELLIHQGITERVQWAVKENNTKSK